MRKETDHPVARDATLVAMECARLFVHHLADCANEITKQQHKTIVMPQAVLDAVKDLEFDFMLPTLEALLAQDSAKKETKKREGEQAALRARLLELEEGRAVVAAPPPEPSGKGRGKPAKRKLETLTIEEIKALLL